MMKPTYTARASRAGRWWAIEIRELRSVHAQARRLDQVKARAREAIGLALQASQESFDVTVIVDSASLGVPLQSTIDDATRAREASEQAQARASEAMRRAVTDIRAAGYTSRDAGMLLGVSNQRISQIESETAQEAVDSDG